ncbi:DUF5658 family protein [Chloroflexota bacterium]
MNFTIPANLIIGSRTMRFMLYTLFCLIVADGLITEFLIANGHGIEANPFLQAWVSQDLFLAIKICGAFLVSLFLWIKYHSFPRLIYSATAVFLAFYTVVVFWNLFVFLTSPK